MSIEEAEKLLEKPPLWDEYLKFLEDYPKGLVTLEDSPLSKEIADEYIRKRDEGVKIYKKLCLSDSRVEDRYRALVSFVKNCKEEGLDMLTRIRDMVNHSKDLQRDALIKILIKMVATDVINEYEKLIIAITLYNSFSLDVCWEAFVNIACDDKINVKYRTEASKFLLSSDDESHKDIGESTIEEIIDLIDEDCEMRYNIIACFHSKSGLKVMSSLSKLKVPYNESFLHRLQNIFFWREENEKRWRILSGGSLLGLKIDEEEREKVSSKLLTFVTDESLEENIRGDAADVLLRLGDSNYKSLARSHLNKIGFSETNKSKTILGGVRTIYNNSQNAHDDNTNESITRFLKKMIETSEGELKSFEDVWGEVGDMIRTHNIPAKDRLRVYGSLNRIKIDTAVFTSYNITLAEILIHVWTKICSYNGAEREEIEGRLIEELLDMSDTCSSGHSTRLINVFSTFDNEINISWESQIKANIAGRMNAKMRDLEEGDYKDMVVAGILSDSDEEDKNAYRKFVEDISKELLVELKEEFVGGGYVDDATFMKTYEETIKEIYSK